MPQGQDTRTSRSRYLLDGRRVTVSDLVDSGLLPVGSALRFTRPQIGEVYSAEVAADGGIVLADGQKFRAPSRAAMVAAGMQSVDGWHAWVVDSSGRSLDSLRADLLDAVANSRSDSGDREGDDFSDPESRHEFLKEARARADENNPIGLSVRDFLDQWGAKGRGHRVIQRIEADLANHGLSTLPNFRKVTFDATVQLVNAPSEAPELVGSEPSDIDDIGGLGKGLTIGNLPSALGGVVSVSPNATFEEAITLMLLNDYSQLAVLTGKHNLRGAVTWKSIAQVRHSKPYASFSSAIVKVVEFRYDEPLIDVLPTLEIADFVFVRDENNVVAGIVTPADVVRTYGDLATPFLLVGELDQLLRQVIYRKFTLEEVASICESHTPPPESFDDLTFGDYQRVLEKPDSWAKLGWPLDRPTFVKRLDELRQLRNDIMHFNNPDPVPPDAVIKLRKFIELLHEYGD